MTPLCCLMSRPKMSLACEVKTITAVAVVYPLIIVSERSVERKPRCNNPIPS